MNFNFRVLLLSLIGLMLAACSSIPEEKLYQTTTGSATVYQMSQQLASLAEGKLQQYPNNQFSLKLDRGVVNADRFRPMLRSLCQNAYSGTLTSVTDADLVVGSNVSQERLIQLAGQRGPVLDFLRDALKRPMTSHIREKQKVLRIAIKRNTRDGELRTISSAACSSYRDGIISLHFSAELLSEDGMDGGAPVYWAVTDGKGYTNALNREINKARVAANREMSASRNDVAQYEGKTNNQGVNFSLVLKPLGVSTEYIATWTVSNNTSQSFRFLIDDISELRSDRGDKYYPALQSGSARIRGGQCDLANSGAAVDVQAGRDCTIELAWNVEGMRSPDALLTIVKTQFSILMAPVSTYLLNQR